MADISADQDASVISSANDVRAFQCLMSSLDEAHASIRSYDTKAQIVGIGFIFSIGVLSNLIGNIDIERDYGISYLIVGFLLLIGPVILFGAVLFPTRKIAPSTGTTSGTVTQCYYYNTNSSGDLETFLNKASSADWMAEIAYEIMKVSLLRDLKRKRFIRALSSAGLSFIIIVGANAVKLISI